jgi:hypothetical protein
MTSVSLVKLNQAFKYFGELLELFKGAMAQARLINGMKKILSVPRDEMLRREAEYKSQ